MWETRARILSWQKAYKSGKREKINNSHICWENINFFLAYAVTQKNLRSDKNFRIWINFDNKSNIAETADINRFILEKFYLYGLIVTL